MSDATEQHGFLLTRTSSDQGWSTDLQFWVSTDSGPVLLRRPSEKPVFFIAAEDHGGASIAFKEAGLKLELKSLELTTFEGMLVCGVYSPTIHLHYRAQDMLRDSGIATYEADIRLHERYLMERFVCAGVAFEGEPVQREGYVEYKNARLKPSDYKPDLKALSLDIECDLTSELFSVGLSGCEVSEVLMIGVQEQTDETNILWCDDEKDLLYVLVERIKQIDPDVLIGWNLINFDLRILIERTSKLGVKFSIGRGNKLATWRNIRGEKDKGFVWIPGRVAIDGIDALKTATYRFPSFSLENVSQSLLGRGKKVENEVDDRFAEIKGNFLHNKLKLAAYNLEDCKLVEDVFDHTQILDFLILRSQITGLEIDRAGGAVAAFSNLYLPRLHRSGYVAPNITSSNDEGSPGGYVMDSRPGLYKDVLVLDFKSLYPSIIRTFKIDPMGLIEGLNNPEKSIAGFRGAKFDREKHFLPEIITELWQQRDIAKENHDAPRSQAIKILMNSFYGVLGTNACRFYDPRLTSSITMRSHEIMQTTSKWIEERGYQVIYGDTDSIFLWIQDNQSNEVCQQIGKRLETAINQKWKAKIQSDFSLECFLELEFETHFSRFLMPTIRGSDAGTKKRYAGLIRHQSDGQEITENIVFKGLENVRTDWTELAKEFQAKLYDLVFHDHDATEFIRQTVGQVLAGQCDDKLVYRKQLRRNLSLYVKNVPPHVKAARLADDENKKRDRPLRYQRKGWISYVLTLNGPEPVEYRNSLIDYQHYVDKQVKPVADAILPFVEMNFDSIISAQMELF